MASAVVYRSDELTIFNTIRDQHRNITDIADAMNHVVTAARGVGGGLGGGGGGSASASASSDSTSSSSLSNQVDNRITTIATCRAVHPHVSCCFFYN